MREVFYISTYNSIWHDKRWFKARDIQAVWSHDHHVSLHFVCYCMFTNWSAWQMCFKQFGIRAVYRDSHPGWSRLPPLAIYISQWPSFDIIGLKLWAWPKISSMVQGRVPLSHGERCPYHVPLQRFKLSKLSLKWVSQSLTGLKCETKSLPKSSNVLCGTEELPSITVLSDFTVS